MLPLSSRIRYKPRIQDYSRNLWVMDLIVKGFGLERKPRIVLGACGCVGALKFELLCSIFIEWAEIRGVVTKSALRFIKRANLPSGVFVYYDEYDWYNWNGMDVELLHWADIMVIAPLSANTLGKIVGGYCDDLLTSTVRAWNYNKKPMFVAPSMNPYMWTNPFTEHHCKYIKELGISLIQPVSHKSAGGIYKTGGMAEPSDISRFVKISYLQFRENNGHGVKPC